MPPLHMQTWSSMSCRIARLDWDCETFCAIMLLFSPLMDLCSVLHLVTGEHFVRFLQHSSGIPMSLPSFWEEVDNNFGRRKGGART